MTSPWLTRNESARYLRMSVDTVDRMTVPMKANRIPGKLRFSLVKAEGSYRKVRILAEDVYAVLPQPSAEVSA